MKGDARKVLKRHYVLLLILCLVGVFYGTEFGYVTSHTTDGYNFITRQDPNGTGISVRINDKSLLDSYLSRINVKVLAPVCLILLAIFSYDMVYSHNHPNIGEGITYYDAYKTESCIVEIADTIPTAMESDNDFIFGVTENPLFCGNL